MAALCVPRELSRNLSSALYNCKRDCLGITDPSKRELHAAKMLNRSTFNRAMAGKPGAKRVVQLVDMAFDIVDHWGFRQVTVFAIVMDRPSFIPATTVGMLPKHIYYLLQRVQRHMETGYPERLAHVIFDESDLNVDRQLSVAFTTFLYSEQGRRFDKILETPLFVSSLITPGSQLCDMVAGCIRHYHEMNIMAGGALADPFVSAIRRYYAIVSHATKNFVKPDGSGEVELFGIYRMPERAFPGFPGP